MLVSDHFKRGPPASRLMPYQIKGEVVKINTVPWQLCFPLEYRESHSFYVWEKAFPHVFKYGVKCSRDGLSWLPPVRLQNTSLLSGSGGGNEAWHYFDSENTIRTGPALTIIIVLKSVACMDGNRETRLTRVHTRGSTLLPSSCCNTNNFFLISPISSHLSLSLCRLSLKQSVSLWAFCYCWIPLYLS